MNAIARLTIKLAELSLRDLRPNPTDIAELHALLIAARACASAVNDPPDQPMPPGVTLLEGRPAGRPFEAQDTEHAGRLKALQAAASLGYAERLQRALKREGHTLTLAAAITVAKEMRR